MVAGRLAAVLGRIEAAAQRSGRSAGGVTLVAVTKGRSVSEIREAYDAGQRDFGENRADELLEKVPQLPGDIRWHFVGTLQSRKAPAVRAEVHLLHSMDRLSLARRWSSGTDAPPRSLLQVNVGEEPQKHGVLPADIGSILEALSGVGIRPEGLMTIPPAPESAEESRLHFRAMALILHGLRADRPEIEELSMGMTDDFEVAVEEGATIVRVGRAIFGPRTG